MKTTNYFNTFIKVAEDCPVNKAKIPQVKADKKTVANLQYEMIIDSPYKYTSDEVLFGVFAERNNVAASESEAEKAKFFSKGQPCFRSSPLTKRYGWGVHSNNEGRIALFAVGSDEYEKLVSDNNLKILKAMRSVRA